jgi:dipeptidase D
MNPTELILERFTQISAIPRGTFNEAGLRAWLQDWAATRNLPSKTDAAGNLVIQVPASAGYESRPPLILQGHLDMVCQKTPVSAHDFTRDHIRCLRDGDWLKADGTTLGADNGIAIALMMALVEDESITHPALELLLTVEEEIGLVGAGNLDPVMLTGKTLINLDSEHEGVFIVGCAGGVSVDVVLPVTWEDQSPDEAAFALKIGGLRGGHSGEDIHKLRANASKLIARVLDFILQTVPLRLAHLISGNARNAIPREAEVIFVCPQDKVAVCREKFSVIAQVIQAEHALTEPGLSVSLVEYGEPVRAVSHAQTVSGLRLLVSLPYGVISMSADIPGFVETSTNIGIVELNETGLLVISSHRSSVISRIEEMVFRIEALAGLAGAIHERTKLIPPWQPNHASPLLETCIAAYERILAVKPQVKLVHAGLECGIISQRCGGLDTISLGPTIENPHSPDERLYLPSLPRVWNLLKELLDVMT